MGRAPRYERMGVRVRQPRGTDFVAAREAERYQGAVSQALGTMSDFLYEKGVARAKQEGIERVKTEGAVPVLEELQAQGGPRTIQDKTAFEAANKIAQVEIQNDAELEITRILNEAEKNVTPFTQVQQQLQDVTDGFSSALSAIDPVAAGVLRSNLGTQGEKAGLRYSEWYVKKQAAIAAARRTEVGKNDAQAIISQIPSVYGQDVDTNVLDMQIALKAKDYVENQGWSAEKANAWSENTSAAAREQWVSYKIQNSSLEQLEEFRDNIVTGKSQITGVFTKDLAFANKAQTVLNARVSSAKAEAKSIASDISEKQKIALNGGKMPDDEWFTSMDTRIESNGVFSADNVQDLTDLKLLATNLSNWKQMDSEDLAAAIEKINQQGIPGYDQEGADTLFEVEVKRLMEGLFDSAKAIEDAKIAREIKLDADLTRITNDAIQSMARVQAEVERKKTAEWSARVSDLSDRVEVLNDIFTSGGTPRLSDISKLIGDMGEIPVEYRTDQYEKIQDAAEYLRNAQKLINAFPGMDKTQVAQAIKELNEGVSQAEDPLTQRNNQILLNTITQFAKEREAQIAADPLLYAAKTGVQAADGSQLEFVPFDLSIGPDDTPESIEQKISEQFQLRKNYADMAQAKFGGQYRLFTNAERTGFAQMLDGANNTENPVMTQMSMLSAMFEGAGFDTARAMMSEISPDHPAYGFAGALLMNPSTSANAMAILEGKFQVDVGGKTIPDFGNAKTESVHMRTIDTVLGDHAGMMPGLKKSAKYIYATLLDETDDDGSGKIVFNEDKYFQALNMALGATYSSLNGEHLMGGIMEYRGQMTVFPQQVGTMDMDAILSGLTAENIGSVSNLPSFDDLGDEKESILSQIRGYELLEVRGNRGRGEPRIIQKDTGDKFQLRLINGNAASGYNYGLYYPDTDIPLVFGDNEQLVINLKKLDEAQ